MFWEHLMRLLVQISSARPGGCHGEAGKDGSDAKGCLPRCSGTSSQSAGTSIMKAWESGPFSQSSSAGAMGSWQDGPRAVLLHVSKPNDRLVDINQRGALVRLVDCLLQPVCHYVTLRQVTITGLTAFSQYGLGCDPWSILGPTSSQWGLGMGSRITSSLRGLGMAGFSR